MHRLIELLKNAKRPLIHVGQGVRLAGAIEAFFSFVESNGLPFVTARNANDICDSEHPLFVGRPGTFGQRGANFAVQTCDIYLAIGTRLSLAQTGYDSKDYARNAKIVVVDIDRAELDKGTLRDPLLIHADAGEFLHELTRALFGVSLPNWSAWLTRCRERERRYPVMLPRYEHGRDRVNSYYLIEVLSHVARADDVIVTDMGLAFQTTHQAWKVKLGQRLMTNCSLAPMGWGLPAAIGACIGSGRRTICIAGDGGFMFNAQELATVAHHKLPIKIFLLNNGGYLTMRQSQDYAFGARMGSDQESGISFPDFGKLAAAFGIAFTRIGSHLNLLSNLENVLNADGPQLCEIMADPNQEQAPKAMNRREADGTIKQTAIEDAYPFLDPAEIADNMRIEP